MPARDILKHENAIFIGTHFVRTGVIRGWFIRSPGAITGVNGDRHRRPGNGHLAAVINHAPGYPIERVIPGKSGAIQAARPAKDLHVLRRSLSGNNRCGTADADHRQNADVRGRQLPAHSSTSSIYENE